MVVELSSVATLVLTYNEEDNIKDCLESINWVDEIVVVDSYSEDKTVAIAQEYTDKIFRRKFDNFAAQRNYGLGQIKSEWVLVVDADERVTPELKEEIQQELKNPRAEGYKIPRRNYFLGKWIKYCGWYPDYTLRLFRVVSNNYRGLVHEGVKIKGNVVQLTSPFIHYTYKDLNHYLKKINQYTTLDAEKKYRAGKKKGLLYIIVRPVIEFIDKFVLRRGFLLGVQGFILSILSSYYQFLKYVKLWEMYEFEEDYE